MFELKKGKLAKLRLVRYFRRRDDDIPANAQPEASQTTQVQSDEDGGGHRYVCVLMVNHRNADVGVNDNATGNLANEIQLEPKSNRDRAEADPGLATAAEFCQAAGQKESTEVDNHEANLIDCKPDDCGLLDGHTAEEASKGGGNNVNPPAKFGYVSLRKEAEILPVKTMMQEELDEDSVEGDVELVAKVKDRSNKIEADKAMKKLSKQCKAQIYKGAYRYAAHDAQLRKDFVQQGDLGVWLASLKYDGRKGVRFCPFASLYIRNSMRRFFLDCLGVRLRGEKLKQLKKVEGARKPTTEPGWQGDVILEESSGAEQQENTSSLKDALDNTEISEDLARSDETEIPARRAEQSELIAWALGTLKKIEKKLIETRYGLIDRKPRQYKEIAEPMGKTEDAIKMRVKRVLKKLRKTLGAYKYSDYQTDP